MVVAHSVAQTVGYKMGMIIGGGVLLQIAELTGMAWPGFFVCMAGIVVSIYCKLRKRKDCAIGRSFCNTRLSCVVLCVLLAGACVVSSGIV
jgi:hypothetical protein